MSRAQSHVVGVSLMVAITVVALGGLTMTIGTVVDASASATEADRVADGMATATDPSDLVGTATTELRFADGSLRVEQRGVRVIDGDDGTVLRHVESDALVYEVGDYEVIGASNAVLRVADGGASMVHEPAHVADEQSDGVLVVGAPALDGPGHAVSTSGPVRVGLRTTVTHERVDLGERPVRIAVETRYPRPWAEYFEEQGATVVDREASFENAEETSVVAEFDGQRDVHLVVHHADLEVAYP